MENEALERIVKVEQKIGVHETRLDGIDKKLKTLHTDLSELISLTSNIRWWLTGVGSFYIANQIGILPIVKKLVGL